jgi:acyl transferase domain-containing protein/acyl carrier protein
VIAGPDAAVSAFESQFAARGTTGRRLETSHAFHSAMMEPMLDRFRAEVSSVARLAPAIPFISNVTGTWITDADAVSPDYWTRHLRGTVRFGDGVLELLKDPARVFLEVGPGRTLATLVRQADRKAASRIVLTTLRHPLEAQPDEAVLLNTLGRLWLAGLPIEWPAFWASESRRRVPLPTYPFERQRYWIDAAEPMTRRESAPLKKADLADWFYEPFWKSVAPAVTGETREVRDRWLVFGDEVSGAWRVADRLERGGHEVVRVGVGDTFQQQTNSSFAIDPAKSDHYHELVRALKAANRMPGVIGHFWGVTENTAVESAASDICQQRGFFGLLFLAQAIGASGWSAPLRLAVVTSDLHRVTEDDAVCPSKATVLGPLRVIPFEYTNITCRAIDVVASEMRIADDRLIEQVIDVSSASSGDQVVALRAGTWWTLDGRPVRFAPIQDEDETRLRDGGVYLITGGFGGIGLTLARALASRVKAKLVLTGRTGLPDRTEWATYLAKTNDGDRTSQLIRAVNDIERAGGEVLVAAADVSDAAQIKAVVAEAVRRFGRLDGVIHSAGVGGGGIIQLKTIDGASRVLAPKVAGTRALAEAIAGRPLDFMVLCSSLTAFGGSGQVDYCAANAYLDAFAVHHARSTGTRTISINWDTWQHVGMAVNTAMPSDLARLRDERVSRGITPDEGADAFFRILTRATSAQVAVSTVSLAAAPAHQGSVHAPSSQTVKPTEPVALASYARPDIATVYAAPVSGIEGTIAEVWQGLLGIDRIGRDDNFFDLGGHSLLLVQAHATLVEKLGREIAVTDLFQFPTIGALAGHLGGDTRTLVRVQPLPLERSVENAVAIVGMAGRFPGAPDLEQFWANLRDAVESIQTVGDDDLRRAGVGDRLIDDPCYVKVASVLDDIDQFDAAFFGYAPREADLLDPQHRVFLECAWEALEQAGYDAKRFPGSIGVYAGASWNNYLAHIFANQDIIQSVGALQAGIANRSDHLPTRTSYKLNLRGPSINVQTACSTSLVAVHEACRSLVDGECDMALAGGVSISVSGKTGYLYVDQGIGSPDGHCRAFDAKAQGTVWGDGVGVVVLKRLADAVRDGDHIHAIIRGTAINNDGSLKVGYTAPSVEGQAAVIARAQAVAGVEPSSIGYIEAHGTGTTLGDPIEIAALSKAFGPLAAESCAVGTLKSNVGHLDAAAGVAGLIKTTLALANRELPPSLHYETPNPKIDFGSSPFFVNSSLRTWESDGKPRRAGVSAFGIGGTNAHAVLEEAPTPSESGPSRSAHVLLLSAHSRAALDVASARLASHLARKRSLGLADVAFTLQVGRQEFGHRRAVVCRDVDQAIDILSGPSSRRALSGQVLSKPGSLGFLFPGEGAYVGMARDLYAGERIFKSAFDECAARVRDSHGIDLPGLVYPSDTQRSQAVRDLGETAAALALFAVEYALAALWRAWGLEPRAVFGQGVGEHVAACVAGALTLDEAISLASGRETSIVPRAARIHIAKDVDELLTESSRVLLEVGPGRALIDAAARQSSSGSNRVAVPSLGRPRSSEEGLFSILAALGQLWIAGFAIDWARFYETERRRRVPLPTYPFERKRHWIEAPAVAEPRTSLAKSSIADWFYVPSWRQSPSPSAADTRNSRWLLFADQVGLASRVADRLAGSRDVIVVKQGARFHQESSGLFTIDPGRADDYQALITTLRDAGRLPDVIGHFWGVTRETPAEPQGSDLCQRLGFFSLLHLAQALGASGSSAPIRIGVVTTDVQGVSGDEMLCPSKATALGPCRVIPSEYTHLRCRAVDLVASEWISPGDRHIDLLINEIASESDAAVVAYRKARRFVQAAEPSRFDAVGGDAPSRIRDGGVYLITGGLGGVGLTLAGHLARSAKARLVLTSRHGLPDRSEWPAYLAGHSADDRVSRQMRAVEELERAGAAVSVMAADVADASKIQSVVDHARQKYGRLNGVIHAAGVAGGGIIQLKTPEAASSVLAPKIKGTQALARALSREDLDFFVLCSSMTALVGGGGQVDYCAANAYLDAFARYHARQTGTLTIAINWDAWQDVGMAVETEASGRMRDDRLALLVHGIAPAEGVEAFLRILARSTSPQIAVSTVPLSSIAERLRAQPVRTEPGQRDPVRSTTTSAAASQHTRPVLEIAYVAPVSEIERVIAGVWQELLGIENIGRDDNFFDLGGHSLLLVQMQGTLSKRMGRSLPATDLFRFPTIGSLAAHLGRQPGLQQTEPPRDVEPAAPAASVLAPPAGQGLSETSASFEPGFTVLPSNAVAIIGMAGRFPGAGDLESFWANVRNGVESIQPLDDEELRRAGVDDEWLRHPKYVKAASTLEDVDQFDAAFFGYSPREAELLDPQQRIFLECAWEALERAGYDARQHRGQISVFAGASFNTYLTNVLSNAELVQAVGLMQAGLGSRSDYLPTRVSYKLNLHGPSLNVQTACSTSLVAVHQACVSLLLGESDMALAGGASITVGMPDRVGYFYQEEGILSPDGHCRAFDARAQGTVFGDGVGIVVLKRLADAMTDGDTVHAVIRGTAINNDGAAKVGFTAPGVDGQAAVVAKAQASAGIDPSTVSYIEAHGTGTSLGDPIEIAALTQVFGEGTPKTVAIGTVKTNVGHLDAAAGVVGLIKTALMLSHRELPPSLHFESPNPEIDFEHSPFFVNTTLRPWDADGRPRRAGVSSFGLGGTNAHAVLEEAPEPVASGPSRSSQLLLVSAKTPGALEKATSNLVAYLAEHPNTVLADVAHTLQSGRRHFPHRRSVVVRDAQEAVKAFAAPDRAPVATSVVEPGDRLCVFLFSGQGSQYPGMARELYDSDADFRADVDACCEALVPHLGCDLRSILYPAVADDTAAARLTETRYTQPALFVVEYAVARLWMRWGIQPAAVIGHSVGEYVAACLAGVFTRDDALALVATRGRLMQGLPAGSMLAVPMSEGELTPLLGGDVSLAAVNAPQFCVASGPTASIDALERKLIARNVAVRRLQTSHAFHSAMMDPVLDEFRAAVARVPRQAPRLQLVSNVTGTWMTADQATSPDYWAQHLRGTVRFAAGALELLNDKNRLFLEVGPGRTLATFVRQSGPSAAKRVALTSVTSPQETHADLAMLLASLGRLWTAGVSVDWAGFSANERRRRVPLPTYPFERQRFWIDPPRALPSADGRAPKKIVRNSDIDDWFYAPTWVCQPLANVAFAPSDGSWLVFTDEAGLGTDLVERLRRDGVKAVTVLSGERFASLGEDRYAIDPRKPSDYDTLIAELVQSNRHPRHVAHLWSVGRVPGARSKPDAFASAQERGYYSVLFLVQALTSQCGTEPIDLAIVGDEMRAVERRDRIDPSKSTVLGLTLVIPQEHPHIRCGSFDVSVRDDSRALADRLREELLSGLDGSSVAYRGGERWTQTFETTVLADSRDRGLLRERGVYLITGGLGHIGLAIADRFAQSVHARLVLVGRSTPPDRAQWASWLESHPADDRISGQIDAIMRLEAHGAEVFVTSADVSDAEAVRAVVAETRRRFGTLHGIVHAAGILRGAGIDPIRSLDVDSCRQLFAPKVSGLYALEDATSDLALDFCLVTSSLSSILGGLGYGAYAAANQFLDAYVEQQAVIGSRRWISANLDAWAFEASAVSTALESLEMQPAEGVECLMRVLAGDRPRTAVSTADLQARIDRYVRRRREKVATVEKATTAYPRPEIATRFAAPVSAIERTIAQVWQKLLGIDSIGRDDNFFDLGGHSLLLIQAQATLAEQFGRELAITDLFRFPTIASLALHLGGVATTDIPTSRSIAPREAGTRGNAIAIVGMAGRFPGAPDLERFWLNLRSGVESITRMSDDELRQCGAADDLLANPRFVKASSSLTQIDQFDAAFFGYAPREAELIDPQHRLFLECAWEALEQAGYDTRRYPGLIGVYAGSGGNNYYVNVFANPEIVQAVGALQAAIGNRGDHLTTRVSYKLNLRGPSVNVQTACSTSLVAVHHACRSLIAGDCDMALAGGVSIAAGAGTTKGYLYQEDGILSPDGHCRAFDAQAQGTVWGDGVGVVVLKRLADALADGDTIRAVIRGTAINNDGAGKVGYTAPSVDGQAAVIAQAHVDASIVPADVSYIEAHGTGTALGDPIEVAALSRAFGPVAVGSCAIGTLKSNVGHLDAAAGVAGLIKTTLALEHRQIPASLYYTAPNPKIDIGKTPFFVNAALRPWDSNRPRLAGVSAFGIGGTNAHVVLEEATEQPVSGPSRALQLLIISARSSAALARAAERLSVHLNTTTDALADIAYTLRVGRRPFAHRRVVICQDASEAVRLLSAPASADLMSKVESADRSCVFMFSGQDPYVNMARDFYLNEPTFREVVDDCCNRLTPHLSLNLCSALYPAGAVPASVFAERRVAQAALFVVEYALARLWTHWGVRPSALIGAGVGEYVAACLAGVLSLDEALMRVAALSEDGPKDPALETFRFEKQIDALVTEPGHIFMEVGLGRSLMASVRQRREDVVALAMLRRAEEPGTDLAFALRTLGQLWLAGLTIEWSDFSGGEQRRRVQLPTYPFERQRYWLELPGTLTPPAVSRQAEPLVKNEDLASWFYAPEWTRKPLAAVSTLPPSSWLIFADESGLGVQLADRLRAMGHDVACVRLGAAFARIDEDTYELRPSNANDYDRLIDALASQGNRAKRIVHLWSYGPQAGSGSSRERFDRAQERGFYSLLALTQALARCSAGERIDLLIGGDELRSLRPGERVAPEKSTILALALVIPQEHAHIHCSSIDLGVAADRAGLSIEALEAEGLAGVTDPMVAYRGGRRWVQEYREAALIDVAGQSTLRANGVYLITGGLGNIGLAVAKRLARDHRAKLVLVSRSTLPAREEWASWIEGHEPDEGVSRQIAAVRDIEAAGGEVLVLSADVADAEQMAGVVTRARAQFGALHGVIHAAGLVQSGKLTLTQDLDHGECERQFLGKARGALVLGEVLEGLDLDFCLLTSSISTVLGGLGYGAYASANQFLDSLVETRRASRTSTRWLSVNLDQWAFGPSLGTSLSQLEMQPDEGVEALMQILSDPSHTRVIVSTGNLTRRVDRYVRRVDMAKPIDSAPAQHARPEMATSYVEPTNDLERAICDVWRRLLGLERVGIHDDFFELGGHSLLATQLTSRVRQTLEVDMNLADLFAAPTVAGLAELFMIRLLEDETRGLAGQP